MITDWNVASRMEIQKTTLQEVVRKYERPKTINSVVASFNPICVTKRPPSADPHVGWCGGQG